MWENAPCAAQPGRETQTAAGKEDKEKKTSPEEKEGQSTRLLAVTGSWQRAARRYLLLLLLSCHPRSLQKPPCKPQGSMENMNLISGSVFLKSAQFQ